MDMRGGREVDGREGGRESLQGWSEERKGAAKIGKSCVGVRVSYDVPSHDTND